MIRLNKRQVLQLHTSLIDMFGGAHGIRDEGLLDLSLNTPFQTFDGEDLYQGTIRKIVHLGFLIIKNHPFVDGNKRIGAHLMLVLFELNGYKLDYTQEELINIILDIASSTKDEEDLLNWVKNNML